MKRKFSKILGVGLTLALLVSLLLTATPVLATSVTQPDADTSPDEISVVGKYTITFKLAKDLAYTAGVGQYIMVKFPEDTNIDDFDSTVFTPATVYVLGDIVHPSVISNGGTYECTIAVGSAQAEPAWPTATPKVGDTETAGGVEWTCVTSIDISAVAGIGGTTYNDQPPNVAALADTDDLTLEIQVPQLTGRLATVELVINGVTNPTEVGMYTLQVKTETDTTYVESTSYSIDAPVVGGFVYVYNPGDILMATYGGKSALNNADVYYDDKDFVIKVGPGTYKLTGPVTISGEGVTLVSTEGADETEIDCAGSHGITITGEDVVIDGFKIDDASVAITVDAGDFTVKNCQIIDADGSGPGILIKAGGTDATIADNVFDDCWTAIKFENQTSVVNLDDVDITGNEIKGCDSNYDAIVFGGGIKNVDIKGNTISANEGSGIYFADGTVACDDITISGNTISANDDHGIEIAATTAPPTKLVIRGNDIIDNEKDGINVLGWDSAGTDIIIFNSISGNTDDNIQTAEDIVAVLNWWGSAVKADITAEFDGAGKVTYDPWLVDTREAVISGSKVATTASSLDAKDDAGVKVSGVADDADTPLEADVISAAKYVANPEEDIDDAIAFYDVYVALPTALDISEVIAKVKFYDAAITSGSVAHFWGGDFWAECSDQEARDGVIYVNITDDTIPAIDELEETIFVVVAGEAVDVFAAPVLLAPEVGANDVSLTPTFAWGPVADADAYCFQLADNAGFVLPMVDLDRELSVLAVTAYAYMTELPYSTAYYWRVRAVSGAFTPKLKGTTVIGGSFAEESNWASGVFITMAEPEEALPPVVVSEAPTLPDITIEQPDIIVPLPDVTSITPSWIYVIIGVGGVLVIAVIVLIVRTRRVA